MDIKRLITIILVVLVALSMIGFLILPYLG